MTDDPSGKTVQALKIPEPDGEARQRALAAAGAEFRRRAENAETAAKGSSSPGRPKGKTPGKKEE